MCQRSASTASPSSITPRIVPSSISVRLARLTRGSLNCGTPLAIASTPVSALQPAEKAFSSSSTLTASSGTRGTSGTPGCGACRASGWIRPITMMASRPTMKTIVGSRNARAASPRPRRLSTVTTARMTRQMTTVSWVRHGKGRCQRRHPGRDGNRDGERVVNDQRGGGDQAGPVTEVGPRHRVRAAAVRVGVDHLAVGEHQDRQQEHDRDGDRQDQVQRAGARHGQHDDDRFRAVGDRRQGVQGQRGQPLHRGDPLLGHITRPERRPDQPAPC